MKKNLFLVILLTVLGISSNIFARPYFDKEKDLLLACFDLKPDEDDVHAAAALACMLQHPDLSGIQYFAVAGAYGIQNGKYIHTATPEFFNNLFGHENKRWTDAHENRDKSVKKVRKLVKKTLKSGGKVFIQEAGQSDFTHDMLKTLIEAGVDRNVIKSKVIVVQHSKWNEDKSDQTKLEWVKNNTYYVKIDDGNSPDNNTPGYNNKNTRFMTQALASENPNAKARSFWEQANKICKEWEASWENPTIANGGVDFSDCVENWWIFDLKDKADSIAKFWERYVINKP